MNQREMAEYQENRVRQMIDRGINPDMIVEFEPDLKEALHRVSGKVITPKFESNYSTEIRLEIASSAASHPDEVATTDEVRRVDVTPSDDETLEEAVAKVLRPAK